MSTLRASFTCCCILLSGFSTGHDPFEGLLPGAPCLGKRNVTGCQQKLLDVFRPTVPYADNNKPDTLFFLFTRANPRYPEHLHECGGQLPKNTNFNPGSRTTIVVHGYSDGICRTAWMREYVDQLLLREDMNVILVDWTWGNALDPNTAASNIRAVGEQIAFVAQNIIKLNKADPRKFHIIGHSFGAHIAGFAGKNIPKLGRITALDVALAPFKYSPPEDRLSQNDALLVDAIHSNAGDCAIAVNIGADFPVGHADFYPNGGVVQESCKPYIFSSLLKGDFLYSFISLLPTICYHLQAIQFFKVSINPCNCQFVGVEFDSYEDFSRSKMKACGKDGSNCAVMGYDFENFPHKTDDRFHKYYLDTALTCPYCDNSRIDIRDFPFNNGVTAISNCVDG